MENKVLFLDFDGVLFDTLKEVYLVCRSEYLKKDVIEPIDEVEYAFFSKYKYLVYNIWMFYYFDPLIFDKVKENEIISEFNLSIQNRNINEEKQFCKRFLNIRKYLVENHYEFWKNLETPYKFFFEIKKIYEDKKINIVVISKKNKISIMERFAFYDFNLPADNIYAREILDKYSSKGEFIEEYIKNNHYTGGIFVDDNINNIKSNTNKNIKNILALWGNTEPNSLGYNQEDAINKIKKLFIK